jgi:hypothetical protein
MQCGAKRLHAPVRRADDADEAQSPKGARGAKQAERPKHTQRRQEQREQGQPVMAQEHQLARRQEQPNDELDQEDDPDDEAERRQQPTLAPHQLGNDDEQARQAEHRHRQTEPIVKIFEHCPSFSRRHHVVFLPRSILPKTHGSRFRQETNEPSRALVLREI